MEIKQLLSNDDYMIVQGNDQINVTNVSYDSRKVGENGLFICIQGFEVDGHDFALAAVKNGAKAIVVEKDIQNIPSTITIVKVQNTRLSMARIATLFYNNPSKDMNLIGVTGTNGKTSTTFLVSSILEAARRKVGLIGTIENRIGDKVIEAKRTTPEALDLQGLFAEMKEQAIQDVIMEVSSHSLELHRVDKCYFTIGIFTNLTLDHLDFHKTMENYREAKTKLFRMCKYGIINSDDNEAEYIKTHSTCEILTFGIDNPADLKAEDIDISSTGVRFKVSINGIKEDFKLDTPGKFSIYNALGAIGACYKLGIPIDVIREGLSTSKGVPGRFQTISSPKGYSVIVDYAHAPDGLVNILRTVAGFVEGKIIMVFGCGGDRDRSKRPIMGRIAGEYADLCIITSDNPRTENPETIITEIEVGIIETECHYEKITDRKQAIFYALGKASKGDVIIIAGKGHETYQQFKNHTIHFDDVEVVNEFMQEEK